MPNFAITLVTLGTQTLTAYIPTLAPAQSTLVPQNAFATTLVTKLTHDKRLYATNTPPSFLDCVDDEKRNSHAPRDDLANAVEDVCEFMGSLSVPDSTYASYNINVGSRKSKGKGKSAMPGRITIDAVSVNSWPSVEECKNKLLTIVDGCAPTSAEEGKPLVKYGGELRYGFIGESVKYEIKLGRGESDQMTKQNLLNDLADVPIKPMKTTENVQTEKEKT